MKHRSVTDAVPDSWVRGIQNRLHLLGSEVPDKPGALFFRRDGQNTLDLLQRRRHAILHRIMEARAKALLLKRERQAAEPTLHRMLDILNFQPPKPGKGRRERLYGDPKTGMDYDTLSESLQVLLELMDSWLDAGCRLTSGQRPRAGGSKRI